MPDTVAKRIARMEFLWRAAYTTTISGKFAYVRDSETFPRVHWRRMATISKIVSFMPSIFGSFAAEEDGLIVF